MLQIEIIDDDICTINGRHYDEWSYDIDDDEIVFQGKEEIGQVVKPGSRTITYNTDITYIVSNCWLIVRVGEQPAGGGD